MIMEHSLKGNLKPNKKNFFLIKIIFTSIFGLVKSASTMSLFLFLIASVNGVS